MITILNVVPYFLWNIVAFFKQCYLVCLLIGWAITTFVVVTIKGILSFCENVLYGTSILLEDFLWFIEDFGDVTEKLIIDIVDIVYVTCEISIGVCSSVILCIISTPNLLYNMFKSLKMTAKIVNFFVLVKDAILLLGICIWDIFALVFTGLSYLNEAPHICCVLLARFADTVLQNLLLTIETYWFRSVCGLCLGFGIYWIMNITGVLPEISLRKFVSMGVRYFYMRGMTAGRFVLIKSCNILSSFKWLILQIIAFFYRQTLSVKSGFREIVREAISHTPTKAALQIKLEKEKASTQCVVCMDKRRDVMIQHCRHLLMCRQCALSVIVNSGVCPVCRAPIDDIIPVYT